MVIAFNNNGGNYIYIYIWVVIIFWIPIQELDVIFRGVVHLKYTCRNGAGAVKDLPVSELTST